MRPYVIVLGNEKGGTGKSTIAMHVAVYLLNQGLKSVRLILTRGRVLLPDISKIAKIIIPKT